MIANIQFGYVFRYQRAMTGRIILITLGNSRMVH